MKREGNFPLVMFLGTLLSCLAAVAALESTPVILRPECFDKKDIIIVLDASSSIKDPQWHEMKKHVADLVGKFKVASHVVRFDVFSFNKKVNMANEIQFDNYTDISDLEDKIRAMDRRGRGTKLGTALAHISDHVLARTRKDADLVVWVLTDGKDRDEELLRSESARLKLLDPRVQVDVLGITYGDAELQKYYNERLKPYVSHLQMIEDVDSFSGSYIELLSNNLCNDGPSDLREVECYNKKDIIIVLDASSSVEDEEWDNMKIFVSGLVKKFHVARTVVRFDVFSYNKKVNKVAEIKFDGYDNIDDLRHKITSMTRRGSGTRLGKAVQHINEDVLARSRKNEGVGVDVWVVTDGKDRDMELLAEETAILGDKAEIDVLGITRENEELKEYFETRLKTFVNSVTMIKDMDESFTDKALVKNITDHLCSEAGTLVVNPMRCFAKRDIIIVLDSSGSIQPGEWDVMKQFVSELVGYFAITEDAVRFDVFRFNSKLYPEEEISFGDYESVQELQQKIGNIQKTGRGTLLGKALKHVNDEVLPKTRPGVDKKVWILTDGISKDPDLVASQSELLRQSAEVDVLAVERTANSQKLYDAWKTLKSQVDYFVKIEDAGKSFTPHLLSSMLTSLCD